MRPTLDELKSLWLHAYARSSLIQADTWVEDMETTPPDTSGYRALVCAIVIAYARPFTKSQVTPSERLVPLADIEPPKNLALTHSNLLSLRNKVIGHADVLPARGHSDTPNKILIHRDSTGFNLHTVLTADIAIEERENIRLLCSHFINHCNAALAALIKKFGDDLPTVPGTYEVLINSTPEDWFKLYSLSHALRKSP